MAPVITSIEPARAVEGGRVAVRGKDFPVDRIPTVTFDTVPARVAFASSTRLVAYVPSELEGGSTSVHVEGGNGSASIDIGVPWGTGLHQVDNPVFDADGNLYVTYSGPRGQEAPVSIFRLTPAGTREPFASGIVNATSMTMGPDGALYVSSRFEGAVYRVSSDGTFQTVASDLGVACGIAFDADGTMFVGDRSGTVFRVHRGKPATFATLPASVAAFHLAMAPTGDLYVAAPTLGSYDHLYRIDRAGKVSSIAPVFGRPQGIAFGPDGVLYVVEALAGASAVYKIVDDAGAPEPLVSGAALVGVAFGPSAELVVTSNDTAYRFDS
jgi:sugar lactone lactonase YvrE